ncbi:MAG: thioredoxin domain-containing protein [Gammaproteobacteria bacterium]|nr:thioredoxin domain-containing protein [Gammaproteobacteria bacterium]NIR84354.1 thioredoxin domain-containing protein [Gammaproteobacteria bacterium]NIR89870.1 thioredoxin domain-containing protein [Gammaproteobacteria bacterium]NIU05737.1 thioredoxin domain-containing protein [Gammaproteobacteria bacterium]NIV52497.1 thioredoxin domain-containing protein [Gammaproteobacteria bacterium]
MKELVDGEVLQEQIAIGIQRFVDQQRAAAQARQQQGARERVKNMRPVSIERDHIYGDSDATVSLIEYSDFECPYCKRFHPIAKTLVDGSGGKVNWVYRHFPLSIHDPGAMREALASECAAAQGGNDAFWKYADAIFERTTSNGNGFSASRLVPLAEEIGLDAQEFQDCLENERYKARVEEDVRDGTAIGITGTPGNILLDNETGEVRVIPGAVPLARLEADLKSLLE